MIIIDYKDTRPIYEQVAEKFKVLILKGALRADEQMPSVRNLAMELSINPNTIQKAYAQLEREGFIYTVKGRGNFIAGTEKLLEEKRKNCLDEILKLVKEVMEYGVTGEEVIAAVRKAAFAGTERGI
ncbi:MAG: GntR family transcriptional regulator [Blautia sp.]|nr:GntR family transcriptional regulator [Blautia sp.]MCM1200379.1 GntR family transcriptional regulator [Bacteroides fragilis]